MANRAKPRGDFFCKSAIMKKKGFPEDTMYLSMYAMGVQPHAKFYIELVEDNLEEGYSTIFLEN